MPGHLLMAECSCGYAREVGPGAYFEKHSKITGRTIAYDRDKRELVTVDHEEAREKKLETIENPFNKSALGLAVSDAGQMATFECPRCGKKDMRFSLRGFWS